MTPNASLTVCASNGISAQILKAAQPLSRVRPSERRLPR